jgi:uncharacterized protein (TIGR00255 family)
MEMKTLNNRFKEFVVRSPHQLFEVEEPVKKLVAEKISRGRIELWIIAEPLSGSLGLTLNLEAAREVKDRLQALIDELELQDEVRLDHILRFDVLTAAKAPEPAAEQSEALREGILSLAQKALEQLMAMREAEGRVLAEDLLERLKTLDKWLAELKLLAVDAPIAATKRYQARLEELAETLLDPARLAQEAAISAEKMDITEEMTRLGSHVQSFRALLGGSNEPVGRRLEFLLQEMVREVNTMGSKSQSQPIGDLVLGFKSELEKIREQALNIE